MFKIENYIAPLILNKVEKFVKNINQQDFQVSLWQGDVVFQNLELKLDVLEEELQLPVTFVSGQIQNLKIQIPWSKIASEPIIITINTIELVVKLKDFSSSPPTQKPKLKKKISFDEDSQAAGYMASLVAKIVHNISIVCNNIVLKFIEEDIVLSMNIQHLSVHSADHRWKRSFIDVSPTNVLFRKLINIIDFTICLDKRNSSGKIEHVQEPILYKCSMELRMYRKFNANATKLSVTRIDVQTDSLDLKISSQQLPMLIRLYDLFMALKTGRLQAKYAENLPQPTNENADQEEDESWISWAWNMIPAILPDEESSEQDETSDKKIFEFGLYVEHILLTLKAQELLSDPIIPSTKKAVFNPIMSIELQEFYSITIMNGVRKFNVKCGIGYAEVIALEDSMFVSTVHPLITAGVKEKTGNYLKDSFMDKSAAPMNTRYDGIWNNYYETNTDEVLLAKTPALAVDILHSVEIPDETRSSDVGSDLEFSNFTESYVIRVFGNGIVINYGPKLYHRIEKLLQYYHECDFLPYYLEAEKPSTKSQLSPATADDYDALINEVPLRIIQMKLKNVILNVKEWKDNEKTSKSVRRLPKQSCNNEDKQVVMLVIKIDVASMDMKLPLYKNRLLYTTCQLPDSTHNELFKKCFLAVHSTLKNIKIDMKFAKDKRICEIFSVSVKTRRLLYPHLWSEFDIPENYYDASIDGFSLMISPPQLVALQWIVTSNVLKYSEFELEKDVLRNLEKSEFVVVQLVIQKVSVHSFETKLSFFARFKLSDILGIAWKSGSKSLIVNWPDTTWRPEFKSNKKNKKTIDLFNLHIQWPKDVEDQNLLPVISLQIAEGSVNLDPLLREFLSFKIIPDEIKPERFGRTISISSKTAVNENVQSMQSSSECDLTICPEKEIEKEKKDIVDLIEVYKNYIFNIEMKSLKIFFTNRLLESSKPSDSLQALLAKSNDQIILIKSPSVLFHSVKNRAMMEMISDHFPIEIPLTMWGNEKVFTWNLSFSNFFARTMNNGKMFDFIQEFSLSISIADETVVNLKDKNFAGNLLVETSPIALTVHTSQIKSIKSAIDEIMNFPMLKQRIRLHTDDMKSETQKTLAVIQESPQISSEIKDFLGLATASTITKTSLIEKDTKKSKSRCSLYVQWICSKISCILLADEQEIEKKFILEIDEILFSLHQQDFYQLKSKIASVSGNFYEKPKNEEKWMKNVALGLNVQTDENSSDNANRFLDLIITKAETSNVHSKWNIAQSRNRLYNEDITEINLTIQALDIIANIDKMMHFMPIFSFNSTRKTKKSIPLAGSELPLLHVNCNGFRIFFPCPTENDISSPDVLIVKVNSIHVTPTAVNNLIRNQIIRPDIHSKACSLGILDLAGSKIEDRQYQLIVKGISLNTSHWSSIAALIGSSSCENYDNPAFEWNNLDNGPKSPNFTLSTIFKDSTFSFIYAPCIRFQQTLVAGTAMEFNCMNEMNIDLTFNEIALMKKLTDHFRKIMKIVVPKSTEEVHAKEDKSYKTTRKKFPEKKSFEDSGVESMSKDKKFWKKKVSVLNEDVQVPFEFTFTSSKFTLRCTIQGQQDICAILDTPNFYATVDKYERVVITSLHDFLIMHGNDIIFSTRDGIADNLSGIKPSLIRVKINEKSVKSVDFDIQIKRPVKLDFSHDKIFQIMSILKQLEENSLIVMKSQKTSAIPIEKKTRKFDSLRKVFGDVKTISLSTNQIVFNTNSEEYDFKIAITEIKSKLKVYDRPEKIEGNFEFSHLTALSRGKIFLHPLSAQLKVKLVQEYWKKDPMVHFNLSSNFIKLDVSWNLIQDIQNFSTILRNMLISEKLTKEEIKQENIPHLNELHPKQFKNCNQTVIEHFQDDLRSGAFQFVETSSSRDLPFPYQIQIVDSEIGVLCWRYPLPRALHKIKIFPVPFSTVNQIVVTCKIEYFSQLKSQFIEFCEFTLTENETKVLDLKQNRPSAEIWRIKVPRVMLKRDSDDEDEGGDYEFLMHPKVLVACLRIDSFYVSSSVPNFDILIDVAHTEVNLLNKIENAEKLPTLLKEFQFTDDRGKELEAAKLTIKKLSIVGQFFDENLENFEVDGRLFGEVVDYGCGNLIPLFEEFNLKTLLNKHQNDMNINVSTGNIKLKYSPAIGHSLLIIKQLWEQNLMQKNERVLIPHTRFIICNNTSSPISLNQHQTNEAILLMPQSFVLYHFRTDKLEQKLQFSVGMEGTWSTKTLPIQIHQEGVETLKLGENQFFIISIKNITNYQRKIIIDGAVSVFNMTKEIFHVQYKRYDKEIETPEKSEIVDFNVNAHQNSSIFGTCLSDSQQSIKLRMVKHDKRTFSGEIPLREIVANNKPWLVKVPTNAACGYTSFWVRIIRETQSEVSRVLVMIWPMFVARSFFPMSLTATEVSQNKQFVLVGDGEFQELEMCGTHEDEHELLLQDNCKISEHEQAIVKLSYKLINRNTFFKIPDEFSDIKKAIELLENDVEDKWPYGRDQENQIKRKVDLYKSILPVYQLSAQKPDQLSCSLQLSIAPWCSIVNSLNTEINLTNSATNEEFTIQSNNIGIPFHIEQSFSISVKIDDSWIKSDPIYINTDLKRTISQSYALPLDGQLQMNINFESGVVQLLLTSSIENKMRMIEVSSAVFAINHTKHDLKIYSFATEATEKIEGLKRNEIPTARSRMMEKCESKINKMGHPIISFADPSINKTKRKFNSTFFLFFAIAFDGYEHSIPLKIQPVNRQCINVFGQEQNISLAISIVKLNEQFFISIQEDKTPILVVRNNTDFDLYIAETNFSHSNSKNIQPHKEVSDDRISWFQTVPKKQKVFYTPPIINENYPEIGGPEFGLIFGCVTGNDIVRWSQPIKIDGTKKIIINVPMFGDLRLDVNTEEKSWIVVINYIQHENEEIRSTPEREFYRSQPNHSLVDLKSNYKKTFLLNRTRKNVFNLNFYFEGISFTIYNENDPIIALNLEEIAVKFSRLACKLNLHFSRIQVDNELFISGDYDFPVVLCNKDLPKRERHELTSIWDLTEFLDHSNQTEKKFEIEVDFYEGCHTIENVFVKFLPIRAYIEDTYINKFLRLVEDCLPHNLIIKDCKARNFITLENGMLLPKTITDQFFYLSNPMKIRTLRIEPLHVLISVHTCMRMYIALDHSPLDFSIYEKSNVYTHSMKLGNNMGMHYLSSAIFGAGWVVGSLEILGSPSGLARSLTSGFKDFVSLPVQGIFKGPWGFVVGLTQGSMSLVSHVGTGTINSVTKLAASLARNLDRLTLDSDHIHLKTDASRRHRPQGLSDGLQQGLTGLGISILGAVGGLARHPLQARSAVEVFTGMGKGLVGVFAKPISGAAELVALTGSGMLQSVGYNSLPSPVSSHSVKSSLILPTASKIMSKQLPQNDSSNYIVFTCAGTLLKKSEFKNAFIILTSSVLVIADLDKDTVIDVIPLEKIHTAKATNTDNTFIFKIKDIVESSENEEKKYPASKRTALYIKQLSGNNPSRSHGDNSEEDDGSITNGEESDQFTAIGEDNKISLNLDESCGKYLINYVNIIKSQIVNKNSLFQLFNE